MTLSRTISTAFCVPGPHGFGLQDLNPKGAMWRYVDKEVTRRDR